MVITNKQNSSYQRYEGNVPEIPKSYRLHVELCGAAQMLFDRQPARDFQGAGVPVGDAGSGRLPRARMRTAQRPEKIRPAAMHQVPPWKEPVCLLNQPMAAGPAKPPRLPKELIMPMLAAAAAGLRKLVGIAQMAPYAAMMPQVAMVKSTKASGTP